MLATVWQVFNMQHRKLKWCKSADIDLENSWNHIRWIYFWRGFVIWNLCAGASNLQQQQPQQQQNYNDYSRMSENNCLSPEATEDEPWNFGGDGSRKRQISLVSICIVSHFEFFSNFKECALALRRLIDTCGRPGWLKKKFVKSPTLPPTPSSPSIWSMAALVQYRKRKHCRFDL